MDDYEAFFLCCLLVFGRLFVWIVPGMSLLKAVLFCVSFCVYGMV